MKRVGLMAGLMVVLMGAGAVAQEPSPEATSLFAPDDLMFTLPSAIGEYELSLTDGSVTDVLATKPEQREFWRQMLLPFGRGPEDGRLAFGTAYDSWGDMMATVFAIRVTGVPAESLTDVFLGTVMGWYEDMPDLDPQWLDVDGRRIQALTGDDYPFPSYLYPTGEVLYFIGIASDDLAIEELLAELP